MKSNVLFLITALAAAVSSHAAESGGVTKPAASLPPAPAPVTAAPGTGPQITGLFRFVKANGMDVITQGAIYTGTGTMATLTMSGADAISSGAGRCAFNVKYDEISSVAALNTTNRLYANDTLIAQNTKLDLEANKLKTVWTQPYLYAGLNNVKIVINADGAKPSTGWIRVNVTGSCGGVTAPAPAPTPAPAPAPKTEPPKTTPPVTTPPKTEPPKTTTSDPKLAAKPPVVVEVKYAPGSSQWNELNTAWGYSNYAVTQLKGKGYVRYAELVQLNTYLTAVINAKTVTQVNYIELMARWNSFVNDAAFKKAMAAIVPSGDGKH